MRAQNISWQLNTSILQKKGAGKVSNFQVGASAQEFNASEHVGSVSGKFTSTITKTKNGYRAVGVYTPSADTYDFDINPRASLKRNAANFVGGTLGSYLKYRSLAIIRPQSNTITFSGNGKVNQSW